jgi:hypothetical protein
MNWFATAFATILAAQQPAPAINYTMPGQVTPPPVTIPANAEILPFQSATVISRPSAAARHFLLVGAPRIPGRGITFTIRCLLDRSNGRVILCQDPAVPDGYAAAAHALGALYQFQLTPAQAAAQGPLAVAIQDRIVPSDVRPAARLFTFTQRAPGNVTFAQVMTGEQSQAYYPRGALQMALDARIRVDCQVQPDLSLFCINPVAAPGSDAGRFLAEFQLAAMQLTGWFRAAPTLSNGAAAPGTVFRTTIIFRVPEA